MPYSPTQKPTVSERVREFFFAEEVPYALALLRIIMPLLLLIMNIQHWPRVRELYSSDGAPAPLWVNFQHGNLLPIFSPSVVVAMYAVLTVVFVCALVGWHTRLSLGIATVLYTYFTMTDSISTLTKFTVISSHILLLLSLSRCGDIWSIDAWLRRSRITDAWLRRSRITDAWLRRNRTASWPGENGHPRSPVWPRRLIAIFVGVVYLGAAMTKMHTAGYFSGDQMSAWMLTNLNFANPIGEWLSLYPGWLVVSAYAVIVWEITFLWMCWKGWPRVFAIGLGYMFHLLTGLLLGLILFPIIYVTLYLALFDEADFQVFGRWIRRRARQSSLVAGLCAIPRRLASWTPPRVTFGGNLGVFATAVAGTALLAVELEYRADVYGERRPEGRYALERLSPERVQFLLTEAQGLEPVDKMCAFDVGTQMLGDVLMDRRKQYAQGETAIVQCSLQPAHADCYVEVQFRDAEDHIVQRGGMLIPRENLRSNLTYNLDRTYAPGDYAFVMRIDGKEVARRHIRITGT